MFAFRIAKSFFTIAALAVAPFCATKAATLQIPSISYMLISAPYSPTAAEECAEMNRRFDVEIQELNSAHQQCLDGAPADDHNGGGTCSKLACQGLHTARDEANRRRTKENNICRERLSAYQKNKQREDEEERRRKEASQRQARETEQADNARRNQDKERRERDDRADRTKRDKVEASRKEERAKDAREADAKRERDGKEARDTQEAIAAVARFAYEAELARVQARQDAERRERSKVEEATYQKLLKQLQEAKGAVASAKAFAANPFEAAAAKVTNALDSALVNAAVDAVMPGLEKHDKSYDAVADVVDKAREKGLAGNPFAERVSGLAMQGINRINRKVLGEVDQIAQSIETFGRNDGKVSGSAGLPQRIAPTSFLSAERETPATARPATATDNPFARQTVPDQGSAAARSSRPPATAVTRVATADIERPGVRATQGSNNPFTVPNPDVPTYYDPDTRTMLRISAGYVLYRDPVTRRLGVIERTRVETLPKSGDQSGSGAEGCSAAGVGVVTVECENKRRALANPFASSRGK